MYRIVKGIQQFISPVGQWQYRDKDFLTPKNWLPAVSTANPTSTPVYTTLSAVPGVGTHSSSAAAKPLALWNHSPKHTTFNRKTCLGSCWKGETSCLHMHSPEWSILMWTSRCFINIIENQILFKPSKKKPHLWESELQFTRTEAMERVQTSTTHLLLRCKVQRLQQGKLNNIWSNF